MATQAVRRAVAKYNKTHTMQYKICLNNQTDRDIIEKLDAQDNKQGYIKKLIREDIKKGEQQ